jgi:TusA-related sulfurtransferase
MKADQTLDCMGLYCPMPIVQTVKKIKELKTGEVLEIVADDRGIIKDMAAWSKSTGHKLLGVEQQGTEIRVFVEKTHD